MMEKQTLPLRPYYHDITLTSMTHYQPSSLPNTRIDAADLLRAVAVAGIVVLHFIEHLNFYAFPR